MRLAIVGGGPQGMEAAYLAKKAGFETITIDRRNDAPAFSLSDEYKILDPVKRESEARLLFKDCDAVIPACENVELLSRLDEMLRYSMTPFLFDINSYIITSSKFASSSMMEMAGIPTPRGWKDCGYPVIVRPSSQTGGAGVTIAYDEKGVAEGIDKILMMGDDPVIQELEEGRTVSVEVIGGGGGFRSFAVTEMFFDTDLDCKRVVCSPSVLTEKKEEEFKRMAETIADNIDLMSLMNVVATDTPNGLKVMELAAFLPSQTPSAVLAATGVNMLGEMVRSKFGYGSPAPPKGYSSSYEHFVIRHGKMRTCGEKEFANVRFPRTIRGLFGADEMITDFSEGKGIWRCTMINSARNEEELERKRKRCIETIIEECDISEFADTPPDMP
ncbi:MAG: 3-methylornithine--L-lysine ligase PylC [Methanomassiliicoccaceae archaeon]|nr:3-methylornithine--L-lysine ligase PylC [Methanomassiliicoccaceae archaeon]